MSCYRVFKHHARVTTVLALGLLLLITFYLQVVINYKNENISEFMKELEADHQEYNRFLRYKDASNRKNVKTILYWNKMYSETHFYFGKGDVFKDCPVPHCFATTQRDFHKSVSQFDAVLFHGIEASSDDLPKERSPEQRYIFVSLESPASRPFNYRHFVQTDGFYNWTMTYRLDSDIPRPYRLVVDRSTNKTVGPSSDPRWIEPPPDERFHVDYKIFTQKKRMVAWFVSHCNTVSKREDLARYLNNYVQVDVYGKCGKLQCNREKGDCYEKVEQDYFFYLSFENSICKDYATEKLYEPMRKFVIPIVYGGCNYSNFAPPHSVINVQDFESTRDLADHLIFLSKNFREYRKYFHWKDYYRIEGSAKSTACKLCEALHDKTLPRKVLNNFTSYYSNNQCSKSTSEFKIFSKFNYYNKYFV